MRSCACSQRVECAVVVVIGVVNDVGPLTTLDSAHASTSWGKNPSLLFIGCGARPRFWRRQSNRKQTGSHWNHRVLIPHLFGLAAWWPADALVFFSPFSLYFPRGVGAPSPQPCPSGGFRPVHRAPPYPLATVLIVVFLSSECLSVSRGRSLLFFVGARAQGIDQHGLCADMRSSDRAASISRPQWWCLFFLSCPWRRRGRDPCATCRRTILTTSSVSSSLESQWPLRRLRLLTLTTCRHSVSEDEDEHDDDDDDDDEEDEHPNDELDVEHGVDEHEDDPKGTEQSNDDVLIQLDSDEMLDGAHADETTLLDTQRHGFQPHAVHRGSPMPPARQMHRSRRQVSHQ